MNYEVQNICACIGYGAMASVKTCEAQGIGQPYQQQRLWIVVAPCTDEGAHTPMQSVEIYGLVHITALRDLLNKAIAIAHKGATAEPVSEAINQATIDNP